jgi:hypothetical protein
MSSLRMVGTGSIDQVGGAIYNEVVNGSITGECCLDVKANFENGQSRMMVFEKYYYRAGNRASLSVMISQIDDRITVDAVSTGGSQGVLIKFNWGAESNFVGLVEKTLRNLGFR